MYRYSGALGALFLGLFLPALRCTRDPVSPTATGGMPAVVVGGTTGSGGTTHATTSVGGSSTGGVTAATSTAGTVEFPSCNPAGKKAAPLDRSKLKLGRRVSVLTKHRKPSYRTTETAVNAFWRSLLPRPLDQGNVGSCTGNGAVGIRLRLPFALETLPTPWVTWRSPEQFETLAVAIYSGATRVDQFAGTYPPDDTGSDVGSAMSVAVASGLFKGYKSVTTLAELQEGLNHGPCEFGVDWFDGFFVPSRCGEMSMTGPVMGGHAGAIVGDDTDRKVIWIENSWGNEWGTCLGSHCGYAYFTYGVMAELLSRSGEAYCPTAP